MKAADRPKSTQTSHQGRQRDKQTNQTNKQPDTARQTDKTDIDRLTDKHTRQTDRQTKSPTKPLKDRQADNLAVGLTEGWQSEDRKLGQDYS